MSPRHVPDNRNDEVFHGHPLAERGLDGYGAYTVSNSRWVAKHQKTNSVHRMYDPNTWKHRRHFFFAFHDDVFECIARGFKVETRRSSFESALKDVVLRIKGS